MDNTVPLISSIAALSVIGVLAFQCMQNNVEGFEEDAAHQRAMMRNRALYHGSHVNTKIDAVLHNNPYNLDLIQGAGHVLESSVNQGTTGSMPPGVQHCALNQPAPTLASSLLPIASPNDSNQSWADPSCVSNALSHSSMLSGVDLIGINTTTSSLRNASHDLRGDPVCNPREPISAFNNSSITCTFNRPLTCYEDLPRPTLWSCDWNQDWWNRKPDDGKGNIPGVPTPQGNLPGVPTPPIN